MRILVTGFSVPVVLLSCLVVSATHAHAEDVIETREVVVSSTRLPDAPVDARTLPAKVTVITAEDIRKSGAKTVQEAIQRSTGIVMYDQVGNAFQQTIDLRGFNSDPASATSVFVDGVRVNEPDFNVTNYDLIPYDTIERIEIIPGASAIYGKNALGGVINIITKRGTDKHQVTGETLFGSFHRERYTINASGPIGKFDYYANFGRETESGYRDESAARISRFSGRVGYRPMEGSDMTLSYAYVKDKLHQAGSLPINIAEQNPKANISPGDFDEKENNFVRFTIRQALPFGLSLNGNAFYRHLDQTIFTVGRTGSTGTTLTDTESRGGTVQLMHEAVPFGARNQLVIGGELVRNNFTNRLATSTAFANRVIAQEDILGFYGQDTLHITPELFLTTGLRYDRQRTGADAQDNLSFTADQLGGRTYNQTTPRLGLSYLVTPAISAYVNYSEGFRVPTVQEMFTLNGTTNLNLKPVHGHNYEAGIKAKVGSWLDGSLTVFQTLSNDIVTTCRLDCDPTSATADFSNFNADRVRRQGIESTVRLRWNEYVDATLNYTITESQFRSAMIVQDQNGRTITVDKGDTLPLVPKHRIGLTGNYHPSKEWTISITGLYVSSQVYLNDLNNSQPRLSNYFVMNARAAYDLPVPGGRLNAFLLINNLLNNHYYTWGSTVVTNFLTGATDQFVMPAPGIAAYGGLSYRFDGL